ncbi:hypothetical protein WKV44_06830, partial [Spirochaetia bacterium 38H-sp]
ELESVENLDDLDNVGDSSEDHKIIPFDTAARNTAEEIADAAEAEVIPLRVSGFSSYLYNFNSVMGANPRKKEKQEKVGDKWHDLFYSLIESKKVIALDIAPYVVDDIADDTPIENEDGVFRIKEELYKKDVTKDNDVDRDLSISAIFSSVDDVELFYGDISSVSGLQNTGRKKVSSLMCTKRGLNYDVFMSGFTHSEAGVAKSLVDFTRKAKATCGAIITEHGAGYSVHQGIGFSSRFKEYFSIKRKDPLFLELSMRRFVLWRTGMFEYEPYSGYFSDSDRVMMQNTLFIPLVYEGRDAYLICGYKYDIENLDGYLRSLLD